MSRRPSLMPGLCLVTLCLAVVAGGVPRGSADSLPAGEDEAALVQTRARELWAAKVEDRWQVVFDLLPPEEQALAVDREKFAQYQKEAGPFQYLSAEVGEVVVDGDTAWVAVKFSVKPRGYALEPNQIGKWEVWIKRDDWRPVTSTAEDQFPSRPPHARNTAQDALLAARVQALWKLMERGDWGPVYEFLDPRHRAETTLEQHMARRARYLYSSPAVKWVETQGPTGRVKVDFMRKLNDPTLTKLEFEERSAVEEWVEVDGQWFRNTKPSRESR